MSAVNNPDKLAVDAVRKALVHLESRTDFFQIQAVYIIHIINGMRVSNINSGKLKFFSIHLDFLRQLTGQLRNAHIDFYGFHFSVCYPHIQIFDAAKSFNRNLRLVNNTMIVSIFSHAADTVAAHAALTSILIEHPHAAICHLGRADEDQAV